MFQAFVQQVKQSVVVRGLPYEPSPKQELMITVDQLLEQIHRAKELITPRPVNEFEMSIWEGVWHSSGLQQCSSLLTSQRRFRDSAWLLDGCVGESTERAKLQTDLATNHRDMQAVAGDEMAMERLMKEMRQIMKQIEKTGGLCEDEKANGFLDILPDRLFGFESKAAKTTYKSKDAQKYLNFNEHDQPVYLQLGWLDKVGFTKGGLGEFTDQQFVSFSTDMDLLGFDHLMVHGRVRFTV